MLEETQDTIVALATPGSYGALSVIRLSGPDTGPIVGKLFRPARERYRHCTMYFGQIVEPQSARRLDEGYLAMMYGPKSYTAEDCAELYIHGGAVNQQRILRAACAAGARLANPGEFTERAFLIDLPAGAILNSIIALGS